MTKRVRDNNVIGPDAESQLIEDRNGNREIRFRSEGSRAMVIRDQEQAIELISTLARWTLSIDR